MSFEIVCIVHGEFDNSWIDKMRPLQNVSNSLKHKEVQSSMLPEKRENIIRLQPEM